ncbi:DUF1461 domain-containing protein [Alcanivorax sp. JB21]|uniref:DUF1461 domain-containing protein n=1 Tax=Alcanivorax limicola TaxID=2874102 RepID=UPI001CBD7C7C|nr:DUF1461 domain-containing protein [Alcanivorax limicola]MBZ2187867.1 DUF1461 domain-containing protein [Alcanivorax limicola]
MRINASLHQSKRGLLWLGYALTCVWLALALSWWLLSRLDYGYPLWYSVLNIEQHIATYAPENAAKPGFEALSATQHAEAFSAIRRAVHDGGRGLAAIQYTGPDGRELPLLIRAEVVHLQDVADLLARATLASGVLCLLWLPLAWGSRRSGLPGWRARSLSALVLAVPMLFWLLIAGPKAVFYQLHIWLFPPENPWFFYWEESLMSTLMKAPYLFGAIALVLAIGALILTPAFYSAGYRITDRLGRYLAEQDKETQ